MVTGSGFPQTPAMGESTSKDTDGGDSFTGTFHGVPGTYACGVANCKLTQTGTGLMVTTGALTFKPSTTVNDTDDAHAIQGIIKDADYLSFGYWVQTRQMGDDMKYSVSTFADGAMPFGGALTPDTANSAIFALHGKATYEGSATGLYARKDLAVVDGVVVGTPAEAGQFTGNTELTAYFGNEGVGSIADDQRYSISGTVDNFQDADGEMIDGNWKLMLNSAMFTDDDVSEAYNAFSGTTGKGDTKGQWAGGFYETLLTRLCPPAWPGNLPAISRTAT